MAADSAREAEAMEWCNALAGDKAMGRLSIETTYSQARQQLKALMDRAVEDREVIVVRRRSGDAVAIIAADELEGLLETVHLLRSPKNAERLLAALARARAGSLPTMTPAKLKKDSGFEA
ncbi:MAG: type II toxin-antitoxin system prevent-host-death family antitoxin [Rhodocyclaceae bacterium]|nr:type II toxin-antitoxin system prevent-host-death family antitoxin [Rhodocyclaceae bacterium]